MIEKEITNIDARTKQELLFECSSLGSRLSDEIIKNEKLQQENKILKENAENNDKVVDKVNWENQLLKKENKQLKNNWNKLKEYIKEEGFEINTKEYGFLDVISKDVIIEKMQELEQGSDSNDSNR